MNIKLIDGQFNPSDAIDIITGMINLKIKFHENKINADSNEEEIKFSETKIKRLQKNLFDIKKHIASKGEKIDVHSTIEIP